MTRSLNEVHDVWLEAWPGALAVWSRFTRLRSPCLCLTEREAKEQGLSGSFAMIRLQDQAVVVSLPAVVASQVEPYAREILAHEVGHHVLAPATLTDHFRMIARMRRALPTLESRAPMVANLYTDLFINDRLKRSAGLAMEQVYRALAGGEQGGAVWALYLRIYELLWGLERRSLGGGATEGALEGDAWLGARLVRSYANDWLQGSGRFASLLLPHLARDVAAEENFRRLLDTRCAGAGGEPFGLAAIDPGEISGDVHPALDPDLSELPSAGQQEERAAPSPDAPRPPGASAQAREPYEYGEILKLSGLILDDHELAVRYYRERAQPYLIPFPTRPAPRSLDPLPEGIEPWDFGSPLEDADWFQSILLSPRVVPGLTTVQRVWGTSESPEKGREPIDLDLYVDSSGSMPNPQIHTSFPALAGAILCLSALRAGARVQVTLWSGKHDVQSTGGFTRNGNEALRVLTGYFGGGTQFPIHKLRDTHDARPAGARPVHILVISDDGVATMFTPDERGASGTEIARRALSRAGAGGSLVLNLPDNWRTLPGPYEVLRTTAEAMGWRVVQVAELEHLVELARSFSRELYTRLAQRRSVQPGG